MSVSRGRGGLTVSTGAVAAVEVAEAAGDGELVAVGEQASGEAWPGGADELTEEQARYLCCCSRFEASSR